jgi:ornithine cyclodeaminase/alanine dehydrogenase-like protein (mu-crystallin family)
MAELLVLSRDDVAQCLDPVALREYLAEAFIAFSNGDASVPARVAAESAVGLLIAMPGFVDGVGLGLKAVTVFAGNEGTDMPSHQGVIALFDPENGSPVVVMDASLITEVRTSVSAAMAVDLAARPDAATLAIIGAGALGNEHAQVLQGVRKWSDVRIASRNGARAVALAAKYPNARAVESFEDAVRGADVVCLCTDAESPVIKHEWLAPGVHVSSVGRGAELPPATVAAAMAKGVVIVEWRGAALNAPPAGAADLQGHNAAGMVELGEVLAGRAVARTDAESITVYKSTGHAIEDLAAARLVLERARAQGKGTKVKF